MKAPGTLTEWFEVFLMNGWDEENEVLHIILDNLEHLLPSSLDSIINKANELKAELGCDTTEKAEDWF